MSRLPLVLCLLALLGSAISGILFSRIGNSKQVLAAQLAGASSRAALLETDLATATEERGALKAQLATREMQLADSEHRLRAAEARAGRLATDLEQTRTVLRLYETTARALAEEAAGLRRDLEESRSAAASPEAVAAYQAAIAELERQLATARETPALPGAAAASTAVFASRAGRATVLTVGPESSFVVLNFGAERGAQRGQKMTVSQGTAEVAIVLISDVRPNLSVAHVLPDTLRGVLQKGDSAILIR